MLTSDQERPRKRNQALAPPGAAALPPSPQQPSRGAPPGGGSFLPTIGAGPLLRGPALLTQPCPSLGCPGQERGPEKAEPNLGTCLTEGLWPGQTLLSVQPVAPIHCARL